MWVEIGSLGKVTSRLSGVNFHSLSAMRWVEFMRPVVCLGKGWLGMDNVGASMNILDFFVGLVDGRCSMTAVTTPDFFSRQIAEARRFYVGCPPAGETALAVVSGGCEHCTADYEIHRRSLPFWGLEFVANGRGKVSFGHGEIPIMPGCMFSYDPRTAHDIVTDRAAPLVKYFVDFTGSRAAALLRELGPAPGTVIQTSAPGEVIAVLDELLSNGLRYTPFSGRIATVIFEHLLLKIAETRIPNGSFASPAFATYRRCRNFIDGNWRDLNSLAAIAAACHVDGAYLCRLFRRFDRQSPYQLLLGLKIRHAATLLRTANPPVAVVAEELHFADPFHFSRVFKKLMGISPSAFARLNG